jgi:hypothetical protein
VIAKDRERSREAEQFKSRAASLRILAVERHGQCCHQTQPDAGDREVEREDAVVAMTGSRAIAGVAESRDEPWRNWDIVELEVVK